MKILVTGSEGQLGKSIRQRISLFPDLRFEFTDIDQLDITDKQSLKFFIEKSKPDVIIHCAAYTAVDKAEDEQEKAYLINAEAVEYLAQLAREYRILLIHISTDFVFDGKSIKPYSEEDLANPISVYGKSKLAGEEAIIKIDPDAIIIRTSWLYSEYGHNFAKTILRLGAENSELNIVDDQVGTPTYAGDLAEAILKIIKANYNPKGVQIFHYSNEGMASWYDFTKEIIEIKKLNCAIHPIKTEEYPLPANRPAYSVMNKARVKKTFHLEIPEWKESLKICLKNLS